MAAHGENPMTVDTGDTLRERSRVRGEIEAGCRRLPERITG
jgi:hypothetical protein